MKASEYQALLRQLRERIPDPCFILEQEDLSAYECDGLPAHRQRPLLVVLPETIEQVRHVLSCCHRHQTPVVTRGGGTGLSGGAMPRPDAVLMGLAKFNRILEIDPVNRYARVQPGVRNLVISEAAAALGLYYAPDPSSQIACTIGGNVAENAGGVHCLKYGLTIHNILELKVLLADGQELVLGGPALDSPGLDLLALMTGSEGMLGVVIEAVVRLLPIPEAKEVLLAGFDDVSKAAEAVGRIIAAGIIPAGLEMMDGAAIQAAEDFVHAGYPTEANAILICELDGGAEEARQEARQVADLLRDQGATSVRIAQDAAEQTLIWKGRKAAFPAVGRISPDYYCMDGTIPRRQLPKVLARIAELGQEFDLRVVNVFHAGDGNLHPLILYDANAPGELQRAEDLGGEILALCIEVGGTITGEHGVGIEKIHQMCLQFSPSELEQFRRLKQAWDPKQILNPGKVIPQPKHCAEYRTLDQGSPRD